MIGGAALVLAAGFGAASIASSLSQTVDVLVASRAIAEGSVIDRDDLRSVSIAAAAGDIRAIAPSEADKLVGQLASGRIGAGSILHPDQFTNRVDQQAERTIIIGAALTPNNLPVLDLLPGDQVRLFETFGSGFGVDESATSTVAREVTDGEVVDAVPLSSGQGRHVAMRINESNANIVANLAEQGRLTLALVDSLPATDAIAPAAPVEPLEPGQPGDE